jgi:hypothetical protein
MARALKRTGDLDVEQAVRTVLGDVLNDMSDELSSPGGGPTNGGASGASARRLARGAANPPASETPSNGNAEVPAAVSDAVQEVIREMSPEQAQALASLFEALGDQEVEEGPETEAAADGGLELRSTQEAKRRGQSVANVGVRGVIQLLKRSGPLFKAAVRAAVSGSRAFNRWVDSLSNFNPVKWAIQALPAAGVSRLIEYLASQKTSVGQRMSAAESDEVEPEEIEQVVRRVLKEALTESATA